MGPGAIVSNQVQVNNLSLRYSVGRFSLTRVVLADRYQASPRHGRCLREAWAKVADLWYFGVWKKGHPDTFYSTISCTLVWRLSSGQMAWISGT